MTEEPTQPGGGGSVPDATVAPPPETGTVKATMDRRRAKLAALQESEEWRLAYSYTVDAHAVDVRKASEGLEPGGRTDRVVRVAGRLELIRHHGGLTFAVLRDRSGAVQLMVDRNVVGTEAYDRFRDLDRGDLVGAAGSVVRTDKGEPSVAVAELRILGKAIRPLPDKDKGLTDLETRYRQRYLDLVTNQRTRDVFNVRRIAIASIRRTLEEHGFWEVEGPILSNIQGGATARPFITHHNALDLDMYLRIALELHLKRLVVGGMERVYELGRVFRNEGIDVRHNPEFTMLEAYQAFGDYNDMMDLVEAMVGNAATETRGEDLVVRVGDTRVDLSPPYPRIALSDLIQQRLGVTMDAVMPVADARAVLDRLGVEWEDDWGSGKLMKAVVDEKIQHEVVEPIFVLDYPQEVSPLARVHRSRPGYVERFELMVAGFELCNAYSEQNDAAMQLEAFLDEARAKGEGDVEAGDVDYDYVRALEYGMPCTGGLGVGIDRLVMLLSESSNIREVLLFPTMRPEPGYGGAISAPSTGTRGLGPLHAVPPAGAVEPAAAPAVDTVVALPRREVDPSDSPSRWERRTQKARRARTAIGALAAVGGVVMLLTPNRFISTHLGISDPVSELWFEVTGEPATGRLVAAHLVTVLLGLGLIVLAGQLARGKRRAWQLCLAIFAAGCVANAWREWHWLAGVYCLAMLVALLVFRRDFRGRSDPPSLFRLFLLAPLYLGAVLLFGFVSLYLERERIVPDVTVDRALETIALGLVGVDGPLHYQQPFFRDFFPAALLALGVAGIIGAVYLLLRPLASRPTVDRSDWQRAQDLVRRYGHDTLAYFALRPDKNFFFGSDGGAFVAYTYMGRFALVSGDPIGAPASVDRVLDEFLDFCEERSWHVALLAARSSERTQYAARGLRHFYLGDEAVLRCPTFSLDAPGMKAVRSATRRVARTHRFQIMRESDANPGLVRQLNAISEEWRGKAPERGFTMALSQDVEGDGANPEFLLCVALGDDDAPGGFLRIVPVYGEDFGYTLDLMRHRPDAPNGLTEFLLANTALALGGEGVGRLSMNFAMWGKLFDEDVHYSLPQRLAKRGIDLVNPYFQIKSLHDFNEKFHPEWVSRDLVYQDPVDLPRVGLLYAGAEGFLAIPGLGEMFVPKTVNVYAGRSSDGSSAA